MSKNASSNNGTVALLFVIIVIVALFVYRTGSKTDYTDAYVSLLETASRIQPEPCPNIEEDDYDDEDFEACEEKIPETAEELCNMITGNTSSCGAQIAAVQQAVSGGDFSALKPHAVLPDGFKLYIAQNLKYIPALETDGFLVYVGLKGRAAVLNKDVFPFYLTDRGKVIPDNSSNSLNLDIVYDTYTNGSRHVNCLEKGVDFRTAACKTGYITSEKYCGILSPEAVCSDSTADCRFMINF